MTNAIISNPCTWEGRRMIRPSFFYFLIYEKIFKMLESGGRNKNKNKNSKIEESKKKKKKKKGA